MLFFTLTSRQQCSVLSNKLQMSRETEAQSGRCSIAMLGFSQTRIEMAHKGKCNLQDSLGGNAKSMMIANVAPGASACNETISTLQFVSRAKQIRNKAVVNQDTQAMSMEVLKRELQRAYRFNPSSRWPILSLLRVAQQRYWIRNNDPQVCAALVTRTVMIVQAVWNICHDSWKETSSAIWSVRQILMWQMW